MSQNTRNAVKAKDLGQKASRRDVLKRALVVLGATAIVQPHGGVAAFAAAQEKKDDSLEAGRFKRIRKGKGGKKGKSGTGGKKGSKRDPSKKEGQ